MEGMREYFSQNHFIESVISKEIVTHWIEELVKYTLELLGFRSVDLKKKGIWRSQPTQRALSPPTTVENPPSLSPAY